MSSWPRNFMDTCPGGCPLYRNAILILYAACVATTGKPASCSNFKNRKKARPSYVRSMGKWTSRSPREHSRGILIGTWKNLKPAQIERNILCIHAKRSIYLIRRNQLKFQFAFTFNPMANYSYVWAIEIKSSENFEQSVDYFKSYAPTCATVQIFVVR